MSLQGVSAHYICPRAAACTHPSGQAKAYCTHLLFLLLNPSWRKVITLVDGYMVDTRRIRSLQRQQHINWLCCDMDKMDVLSA